MLPSIYNSFKCKYKLHYRDKFVLSQDFNSYLEELSNNNLCDMISEDL